MNDDFFLGWAWAGAGPTLTDAGSTTIETEVKLKDRFVPNAQANFPERTLSTLEDFYCPPYLGPIVITTTCTSTVVGVSSPESGFQLLEEEAQLVFNESPSADVTGPSKPVLVFSR